MPCFWMKLPDGTSVHINAGRAPRKRCGFCPPGQANLATLLCDFEVLPGKTCDRPICASCATPVGEDMDHCPNHASERRKETQHQKNLFATS